MSHAVFLWQFHTGTRWSNTINVIPTFPKFKLIEWSDRSEVEQITDGFPPYSDFNFVSLYSWNTRKKMMVSQVHHNLVILFYDYVTEIPFLAFIGKHNLAETAVQLIDYSQKHYHTGTLKLIPQSVASHLPENAFTILPDEDSYDYIFSIPYLANFSNCTYSRTAHHGVRYCQDNINLYPHLVIKHFTRHDITKAEYIDVFKQWAKERSLDHRELNEYSAFDHFIQNPELDFDIISIYDDEKLIAFTAYEILHSAYAVNHFLKAERIYKGLYERLHFEMGKALHKKNIEFLNGEQDLGLPGLRQSKKKFKPVSFLKKYIVELK